MSWRTLRGWNPVFQELAWARQSIYFLPLPATIVRVKEDPGFPANSLCLISPVAVSFSERTGISFQPCHAGIPDFFDVLQHWKAIAIIGIRDSSNHGLRT